jgi:hypothetical protein
VQPGSHEIASVAVSLPTMKLLLPISFVAAFELTFFVLAHIARRFRCDRQPGKSRSLERFSANPLGRGIRVSHARRHHGTFPVATGPAPPIQSKISNISS